MTDLTERIADVLWRRNPNLGEVVAHDLAAAVVEELHIEEGVDRWIIRKAALS